MIEKPKNKIPLSGFFTHKPTFIKLSKKGWENVDFEGDEESSQSLWKHRLSNKTENHSNRESNLVETEHLLFSNQGRKK